MGAVLGGGWYDGVPKDAGVLSSSLGSSSSSVSSRLI